MMTEWLGLPALASTDWPVAACMASQYAGWQLSVGKFFAMGSGPMRAAAGREAIFDKIGQREEAQCVVGALETRKLPGDDSDEHSRYLEAEVGGLIVGCLYLPNGNPQPGPKFDYKLKWFERLVEHAATLCDSGL